MKVFQESQAEGSGCFHSLVLCLGVESGTFNFCWGQSSRLKSQMQQRMTASLEVSQRLFTGFCPNGHEVLVHYFRDASV